MSSHHQRLLTGLVLLCLLAGILFAAPPVVLTCTVMVVSWLALYEFWSLFWPGRLWVKGTGLLLAVPIVWAGELHLSGFGALLACVWLLNGLFLGLYARGSKIQWSDAAVIAGGLAYLPVSLQYLGHISTPEIVFILVAVFMSDTVAFYAGSQWGRRKLWPAVSPKKTWMGSLAGLGACVLVCLGWGLVVAPEKWPAWIGLGAALNLAAQTGDLFESALKRDLGVKDSGTLLPGHGGVLDRIDSLVLAIPVYMLIKAVYPLFP